MPQIIATESKPPQLAPRRRDSIWWPRMMLFATCVLIVNALIGERGLAQTIRARREFNQSAAALSALRAQNVQLREQARRLREDPATIEAVARQELGLMRPGELLVVVKDLH